MSDTELLYHLLFFFFLDRSVSSANVVVIVVRRSVPGTRSRILGPNQVPPLLLPFHVVFVFLIIAEDALDSQQRHASPAAAAYFVLGRGESAFRMVGGI